MKVSKELKKKGKVTLDGPKLKQRRKFAPPVKSHKPKKGKGAKSKRSKETFDEDDEKAHLSESVVISKFVEAVLEEKFSEAHKYLRKAVETNLSNRIEREVRKPLHFQ